MPAVSLPTLSTLNAAIVPPGASVSGDPGNFQALLDIGAPAPGDDEAPKDASRKDARLADAPAAAIDAPNAAPDKNIPPRAESEREEHPASHEEVRETEAQPPTAKRADAARPVDRPLRPEKDIAPADKAKLQEASAPAEPQPAPVIDIEAVLAEFAALQGFPAVSAGEAKLAPAATPAATAVSLLSIKTAQAPQESVALPEYEAEAILAEKFPSITPVVPTPVTPKQFLARLERLMQRIETFLAGNGGEKPIHFTPDGKPVSLTDQLKAALETLRDVFKQVASGDMSVAEGQKEIKPIVAELRQLLPRFTPAAALLEKIEEKPAPVKEALPAAPAARGFAERAEAAPNLPQAHAATASQAIAAAASAENAGADTGGRSGNFSGQNLSPSIAARPVGPDAPLKIAGGADFAKLIARTEVRPVPEQVVFHIKTALKDGSSKIHIQLEPAELGKLDIKLHVDAHGKTGVTITADNKNTLDLLQRDARGLERALSDAGLNTDAGNLSFNLKGGEQQKQEAAQAAQTYQKVMPEAEEKPTDVRTLSYVVNLAEGLDIRI